MSTSFGDSRQRLVALLTEAAELEHNLSCQYLFAAFTLKTHREEGATWEQLESIRRWKGQTLMIARQEMEHLGLVSNLLCAIGEAPYFQRPEFPTRRGYYPIHLRCALERFGLSTLERFVRFEHPLTLSAKSHAFATKRLGETDTNEATSIARMYHEILALFQELGTADPKSLFIGPATAQQTTTTLIPVPLRGISLKPGTAFYNVLVQPVTDLETAEAAVRQILLEGEGAPDDRTGSHFARFLAMHEELAAAQAADPEFDPARDVMKNPRTSYPDEDPTDSTVTVEATNRLSQLFDLGYAVMITMLIRFFYQVDATAAEIAGLQRAAFFPMMTTFIRPVGELLTQLPAREDLPGETAGPSFRFLRQIAYLPHKHAAWKVIESELQLLQDRAQALSVDKELPEGVRQRLVLVYENLGRMAMDFSQTMNLGDGSS